MDSSFNRVDPPAAGEVKNFTLPQADKIFEPSGQSLYHYQRDILPIVNLIVAFPIGVKNEKADKQGFLHLLCAVLDEGTKNLTSLEFSDKIEFLGSSVSVHADYDFTLVSVQSLKDNFKPTMELVSEMLMHPRFDEQDFNRETNKALVRLRQMKDIPDAIVEKVYREVVYGKNKAYASSTYGKTETISKFKFETLSQWYNDVMMQQTPAIFSAGAFTSPEFSEILRTYPLSKNSITPDAISGYTPEVREAKIYIVHKESSVQTEIVMGHQTNGRTEFDFFTKIILNMIFGGQFSSRLNLNLREKNGLTYGVSSGFSHHVECGDFRISTSVSTSDTGKALKEIISETERLSQDITLQEVEFAKSSLINRFTLNFETNGQLVANSFTKHMFHLPDTYYETYIDNVMKTGLDGVVEAARKRILKNSFQIVLVGNAEEIEKSLLANNITIPIERVENDLLW